MKRTTLLITILITTLQSFAQWTEFPWDTITFEEPYEYITIDTSNQNIWQIGEPNKTFFDSSYSITNAIITDTINYYPINNYSYFDLKIGNFNYGDEYFDAYPYDIFIEIKHKFDTDILKDGGFITVSYDNGNNWMNIIKDTVYNEWEGTPAIENSNLYTESDTLFNGEYGFSGNSNAWITTMFSWHFYVTKNNTDMYIDTMLIRFNFISDNIENNKEGWMIDNIKLYSVDLGNSINFNYNNKSEILICPNPATNYLKCIVNTELLLNTSELIIYDIYGKIIIYKKIYKKNTYINISDMQKGIYFIKVGESVAKFVKE